MREIVFDTETTGLSPRDGHRLVEIGCIEIINRYPTGQVFHKYLNPERDMPFEAFEIHGLSSDFLKDKPLFADVADEFEAFISGAQLVAHNAGFDIGFINAEFARVGKPPVSMDKVIDTVVLARRKFPGAKASLDALCSRFGVDNSKRTKHGALLDAEILAEVYSELLGGKQSALVLDQTKEQKQEAAIIADVKVIKRTLPLAPAITLTDIVNHSGLVEGIGEKALWNRYIKQN